MDYTRFEWLTIAFGAVIVAGMTSILFVTGNGTYEAVVAQLLLLTVLVAAVHWGRNAGFLAAVGAIVADIALRAPALLSDGLSPASIKLIALQAVIYGAVGIAGGETVVRLKYVFASLAEEGRVDAETRVYAGHFLGVLLDEQAHLNERYGTPYSLVCIALSPSLLTSVDQKKRQLLVRSVAARLRDSVRLVDDVGRLADDTFLLVLPHTPRQGAATAAARVRAAVVEQLGTSHDSVQASVLAPPDDAPAIAALRAQLVTAAA